MISDVCLRLHVTLSHCFLPPAVLQKSICTHDSLRSLDSLISDFTYSFTRRTILSESSFEDVFLFTNRNEIRKQQWQRAVRQWEGLSAAPVGGKGMAFPHRLTRTPALGSRSRLGPGGALCGTGAPHLPEIHILLQKAMPISYDLHERWQRTSPIVYGVSAHSPLRRRFMETSSALMYIIQKSKVTT